MRVEKSDWLVKRAEIIFFFACGNQGHMKLANLISEVSRFVSLL